MLDKQQKEQHARMLWQKYYDYDHYRSLFAQIMGRPLDPDLGHVDALEIILASRIDELIELLDDEPSDTKGERNDKNC